MLPKIRAGAVLYTKDTPKRGAMAQFARALIARGWRVGGLVQEVFRDDQGRKIRVETIDITTGARVPINQPTKEQLENKTCSLDPSALTEAGAALRQAIRDRVDLMVVEKFGEQEQEGGGLAQEILTSMAEGIPVLVMVPAGVIDIWQGFCGGAADLLACEEAALWRWWGAEAAREELARAVADEPVRRVVVGLNWTLVEGPDGCGLAHSPVRGTAGCRALANAGELASRSLAELAGLAHSWNPFEAAIGAAAINAHYNRYDLEGIAENGLDAFRGAPGPITVVGRFPGLAERLGEVRIIECEPADGEFPPQAAPRLLRDSEAVIITASAFANRSLAQLLAACRGARVALVGPGTPLAPALHAYGIEILAGQVVSDPEKAAHIITQGGAVRALKQCCRMVSLRA